MIWHKYNMQCLCDVCCKVRGELDKIVDIPPGYEKLAKALEDAFNQAAFGKGKKRHANDKPFTEQPIMQIARMVGVDGHTYQIMKKAQEAGNMVERNEYSAAIAEFYGVINYAAAAILLMEETKNE